MKRKSNLTPKLKQNWWIDAVLGLSAVFAILSSLYFLAFPVGGYQGGRNPYYNIRMIFDRYTWDMLHTWTGVLMIMTALLHIIIHWSWITGTANRTWQVITGKQKSFAPRLTYNIFLDVLIGISFVICAVSGIFFLLYPNGGQNAQSIIISRYAWDMLHTWSGVVMTIAAILHFALHWKWVVNITGKLINKNKKETIEKETPYTGAQEAV